MKHPLMVLFSVLPAFLFSQTDNNFTAATGPAKPDTVNVYHCQVTIKRWNDTVTYYINNKQIDKQEFDRIDAGFRARKKCNPCYLRELSLDERLLSAGLYYSNCPDKDKAEPSTLETETTNQVIVRNNSCKDGTWTNYKKNGKVKRTEYYEKGRLVRKK